MSEGPCPICGHPAPESSFGAPCYECVPIRMTARGAPPLPPLKIGDRIPMPPAPKLDIRPAHFVDSPAPAVFGRGKGKR